MPDTELTMEFVPTEGGVDTSDLEDLVLELKSEFQAAPTTGYQINETQRKNEGALGPEWLPILTAVVSSQLAVEVAKGHCHVNFGRTNWRNGLLRCARQAACWTHVS